MDAPTPQSLHTAIWTGSRMVVWGGSFDGSQLNSGGQYDPATDAWIATSTMGAPAGRVFHTAAWAASRVIVWGGYSPSAGGVLGSGGQYLELHLFRKN